MSLFLIFVISITVATGVLLTLSKDLFRLVMGLAVLGISANLIVYMGSRPDGLIPPVVKSGQAILSQDAGSPLPQALLLTAIVIGFALICIALLLCATLIKLHGHADVEKYRESEPGMDKKQSDGKPPTMESDPC